MTQSFNQDVHITNTTGNNALEVTQNGNAKGIHVDQNTANWGVHVEQGAATKYGIYVDTAGYGIGIRNSGTAAGLVFTKVSTGGGNCCYVENAGTGKGFYVKQNGEGIPLHLNKNSTGASQVIRIDNAGIGADIQGHNGNWQVEPDGDAYFANVDCHCGIVTAKNTAIAGGRVHIWAERSQGASINTDHWCSWGLDPVTPLQYGVPNDYSLLGLVQVNFEQEIQCPIIKLQPWLAGHYSENASGIFDGPLALPLAGTMSLELSVVGLIPGTMPTCATGFFVAAFYCLLGQPAEQGEYLVEATDPPSYYQDLVFDFEVLGCPCEILL